MILEGNQRGGARKMAYHLLNMEENEHVEIHEISGFLSENVLDALQEVDAISCGTKCKQFMFSVSLSPPKGEIAPVEYFETAIARIEESLNLKDQSRVVVFHEKEGRRHAHCIWSRIDADEMKAINLPFYKTKLNEISKQLFLEYGWELPQGFIKKEYRNPLNFTRQEWQQAKRAKEDPRILKQLFKQMWEQSDNQKSFTASLKEHGFWLARGDRRGFVAVDYKGEVYSLSRWIGVKTRELKNRINVPDILPSVQEAKTEISQSMTDVLKKHIAEVRMCRHKEYQPLKLAVKTIKERHQIQRHELYQKQKDRWKCEEKARINRVSRGLKGLWHRITGKYQKIQAQNEVETKQSAIRDRDEKQTLINQHLKERGRLQNRIQIVRNKHNHTTLTLRQDIGRYVDMGDAQILQELKTAQTQQYVHEPEM